MDSLDWVKEFPSAVTVCDKEGRILYMNERSADTFKKKGGLKLIGTNVLDCHPEPSKTKLKEMLENGKSNVYTIEKNNVKKLINQSPWYREKKYAGFVEISIEIPSELPNFQRE